MAQAKNDQPPMTPPRAKGKSNSSGTSTPLIRPTTPSKRTKQEYLFDLWVAMHTMCAPMTSMITEIDPDTSLKTTSKSDDASASDPSEDEKKTDDPHEPEPDTPKMSLQDKFRQEDDFARMAMFLRSKKNVELVARWWSVLNSFVHGRRMTKGATDADLKQARIILTALMVRKFPLEVLEFDPTHLNLNEDGQDESGLAENVFVCSKEVVSNVFRFCPESIETDLNKMRADESLSIIDKFGDALDCYKNHDRVKVLDSLKKYYRDWLASKSVLIESSLNEMQRDNVLKVIQGNLDSTRSKMVRLVGIKKADEVIEEILASPEKRPNPAEFLKQRRASSAEATTMTGTSGDGDKGDEKEREASEMKEPMVTPSPDSTSMDPDMRASVGSSTEGDGGAGGHSPDMMTINLDQIVREEGSKLYWRKFGDEIREKKYDTLFAILTELLARIQAISPDGDLGYLGQLIDVDFIQHTIDHGALDAKTFYSIFNGIWTQCKRLHAPMHDTEWKEWHDGVLKDMASPEAQWAVLIPQVMNRFLCKLDEIESGIARMTGVIKKGSKLHRVQK